MRKSRATLALIALGLPSALPGQPAPDRPVAIVGATLIDGSGAPPVRDAVVVIRGPRIAQVGRREDVVIPPGSRHVDARGKWLLPGLIDMHVHLDEVLTPGAFVLYGVTSVRDCGSRLVTLQQLRARAARGEAMPRLFWLGRNIDQGAPSWSGAVAVRGPAEVPALLDDMAKQGVDGVKLYVRAGPAVTRAVIADAHRRGWPVTAHLEDTTPLEAADAGIDNLEHVSQLFVGAKPKASTKGFFRMFDGVAEVDLQGPAMRTLFRTLAERHVAVTPTLAVVTMPVGGERGAAQVYGAWAPVPDGWRDYWQSPYWDFISVKGWTAEQYTTARAAEARYRETVGLLYRDGVPLIAGTDTPAPWVLPGAGLVRELETMASCGVPNAEVIHAATGRAADVLRKADIVGTVRVGLMADLLLVDADPLRDIRALRRVSAVYVSGREADRVALAADFRAAKAPAR